MTIMNYWMNDITGNVTVIHSDGRVEDLTPEELEETLDGEYEAGYAYACGYHD